MGHDHWNGRSEKYLILVYQLISPTTDYFMNRRACNSFSLQARTNTQTMISQKKNMTSDVRLWLLIISPCILFWITVNAYQS